MTETKQALDAVVALVDGWRKERDRRMVDARNKDWAEWVREHNSGIANGIRQCADDLAALLPDLRAYIHRIQTSHPSYDNAVRIRQLEEQVEQLQAALGEAERDAGRLDFLDSVQITVRVRNGRCYDAGPGYARAITDIAKGGHDAMAAGEDAK